MDQAGQQAQATVKQQLVGVSSSGQVGLDGLWTKLMGKGKRVVLALVDTVTGVIWPPVVVEAETTAASTRVIERAEAAGLDRHQWRGLVSDGASGFAGLLNQVLSWVNHQRCVFHLWRDLWPLVRAQTSEAAKGLSGAAATAVKTKVERVLVGLIRAVYDAPSQVEAAAALAVLAAEPRGAELAARLAEQLDGALVYRLAFNAGLARIGPEAVWRDFRLRLSHGRNHRSAARLERAVVLWSVYHNFEPAQERREQQRKYRRPGESPFARAGAPPGPIRYLDALAI